LRAADAALTLRPPPLRLSWMDAGLVAIIVMAIVLAFVGTHGRPWLRRGFQVVVIGYVGFFAGAPLAQSLFAGWTQNGVPWRSASGLVLLAAAALAIPWATRKPLYCQHLCPHGAAQELLGHFAPRRWRFALPKGLAAGLRWLPPLTLGVVVIITIMGLPMDLAHLEPFDAYSVRAAGAATVAIAVVGLVASLFVPMAYCRYGCPTGALLEFIRARGSTDHFGRRDVAALLLVGLAEGLAWKYQALHAWVVSTS
jgi:polyferredoxin